MAGSTSQRRGGRRLWAALVAVLVAAGVVVGAGTSVAPADTPVKAPLSGIVDRNGKPASGWESVVNNYVVRVDWAALQTTQGGAITSNNDIDKAIAAVQTWNATNTPPEAIKIRIDAGDGAPDWAKNLDGPGTFVTVASANGSGTTTVGRFWKDNFGAAYNDLQSELAAKYDTVPEIHDVTISRCTLTTVEPFLRTASDQATVNNLVDAGYSVAADDVCQHAQIDEAKAVWTHTPSSLALNPYQQINSKTDIRTNEAYTEQMMGYCRTTLGSLCVLENNSIRDVAQGTGYVSMYNAIKNLGPPITFQTASKDNIGSLCNTLRTAVLLGANSVEIPGQYSDLTMWPTITQDGLSAYDHALDRLPASDTTSPSAPGNLHATVNTSNVSVTWGAAADDSGGTGVACYTIARNGMTLGTTMQTSFTDTSPNTNPPTKYTVTANDGAGNFGPAAEVSITPPITTLSTSHSTITYGSPVTFTATVTSQNGGTPGGNVNFLDGSTFIGSGTLSNGQAQYTTTTLATGGHSISAAYQGDSVFPGSSSSAITETVSKADSSTALTNAPTPSSFGQPVTLTATVSPSTSGTPTGTVTFMDGSTVLGSAGLVGGQASMTTSTLTVGRHTLAANYTGDGNFNPSSDSQTQTVSQAATSTAVTPSANPVSYGSSVTFTATVSSAGGVPTGTVTFKNGTTTLGTITLNASGQATLTTSALTKPSNSITAVYGGDANFVGSTSPPLNQGVNNLPSSTSMTASPSSPTSPSPVTLSARVSSTSGTPTGTVTFFLDGSTNLGTATLSSGRARLSGVVLSPGGHLITAQYNGDGNFAGSTSHVVFERVKHSGGVTSRISLVNNPTPSTSGQTVMLTATITGAGATGMVSFFDNGTLIGQAPVSSGQAVLNPPWAPTAVGRHKVTAGYSGDGTFNPALSSARTQTVNP